MGNSGGGNNSMIIVLVMICGCACVCLLSSVGLFLAYNNCALAQFGLAAPSCKKGGGNDSSGIAGDRYVYIDPETPGFTQGYERKYLSGTNDICTGSKPSVSLWCKSAMGQVWKFEPAGAKNEYYIRAQGCVAGYSPPWYLAYPKDSGSSPDRHFGPVLEPQNKTNAHQKWIVTKSGNYYSIKNKGSNTYIVPTTDKNWAKSLIFYPSGNVNCWSIKKEDPGLCNE